MRGLKILFNGAANISLISLKPVLIFLCLTFCLPCGLHAVQRFPRPDFETDYVSPVQNHPGPRALGLEYIDVAVLAAALALATYFALKQRSRRGLLWLGVFCLLYFGFWRRGCVCAIGSVQNVTLAFADQNYVIPLSVVLFFSLPLIGALFWGRTFCAAVCPFGVAQELVAWRPTKIPLWLNHVLGLLPILYLGLTLLFVITGTGFLICRWDPFIGFFRMGASFGMLIFGVVVLVVGMFIARPYCRFLCPYGVLLGWMSGLSRRHLTISPTNCIRCRLCENACPIDAIRKPTGKNSAESRQQGVKRLVRLLVLIPLAMGGGALAGFGLGESLSFANSTVALAHRVKVENEQSLQTTTVESDAFRQQGETVESLYLRAGQKQDQFQIVGAVLGAFIGFIVVLKMLGLSLWRTREDYEPDRVQCVSCGRCFSYCPLEVSAKPKVKERMATETEKDRSQ